MSYYLSREQQRCRTDCVDAQADLRLCCSPTAYDTFSHDLAQISFCIGEKDDSCFCILNLGQCFNDQI